MVSGYGTIYRTNIKQLGAQLNFKIKLNISKNTRTHMYTKLNKIKYKKIVRTTIIVTKKLPKFEVIY